MRRWSHDEEVNEVLPRGPRACHAHGARGAPRVQLAVGGNPGHCPQDRLHDTDAVQLDAQHERDTGQRDGVSTAEARRIKELERENRELKRVNEILCLAGAFSAQAELGRHRKS